MIEQLKILVESMGMAFFYGTRTQFNTAADKVKDGYLVYHEGYIKSRRAYDGQGAIIRTYPLALWVYAVSNLPDTETNRLPRFQELSDQADALARRLKSLGKFDSWDVVEGVNRTDRNLDGVLMTGNLIVAPTTRC